MLSHSTSLNPLPPKPPLCLFLPLFSHRLQSSCLFIHSLHFSFIASRLVGESCWKKKDEYNITKITTKLPSFLPLISFPHFSLHPKSKRSDTSLAIIPMYVNTSLNILSFWNGPMIHGELEEPQQTNQPSNKIVQRAYEKEKQTRLVHSHIIYIQTLSLHAFLPHLYPLFSTHSLFHFSIKRLRKRNQRGIKN